MYGKQQYQGGYSRYTDYNTGSGGTQQTRGGSGGTMKTYTNNAQYYDNSNG